MRAAHVVGPRRIELLDVDEPDLADYPEGTVKIRTEMSAICGTDVPSYVLERPASEYPLRLGMSIHEAIGTVVGSTGPRFKEGDRVLALPRQIGGLAEYFLSHEEVTMPLSPHSRQDIILMSQPLGTVIWACRKLGSLLDKEVAVYGQGPMGLLWTHVLSNLGARSVIAIDEVAFRLERARLMRATHLVNAGREDVVARVRELTDGRMADIAIEMVGHNTTTINTCIDLVRRLGTVLAFGVPDDDVYPIHYRSMFTRNVSLIASVNPDAQRDFPLAMDWITQGRIDVEPIITHHLPFTEVAHGFDLFVNHRDEAIKVVLEY